MSVHWVSKSSDMILKWRNELLLVGAYVVPADKEPSVWVLATMLLLLVFWHRPGSDPSEDRRFAKILLCWCVTSLVGVLSGYFFTREVWSAVSLALEWLALLGTVDVISKAVRAQDHRLKLFQLFIYRGEIVLETVVMVSLTFFAQRFWPGIWFSKIAPCFTICVAAAALWSCAEKRSLVRICSVLGAASIAFLGTKIWSHSWTGRSDWVWLFLMVVAFGLTELLRHGLRAHSAGPEALRLSAVIVVSVFLYQPLAYPTLHGTGDAQWYATMLADMLEQVRHGIFPVWSGQSIYQFNGAIYPLRVAPAFHYIGAGFDLLSLRSLNAIGVQNLMLTSWGVLAALTAYLSLAALRPLSRNIAACGAILFAACPGVMSVVYNTDLFMSWMTIPLLPIVFYALVRSFEDRGSRVAIGLGAALGFMWWGHTPIALWTTIVAAVMQMLRLFKGSKDLAELHFLFFAAVSFLAVAAYPIVSVLAFPPEQGVNAAGFQRATPENIVYFLKSVFPAVLMPIQDYGTRLSSFQLGYSLWLVFGAALVWGWRASTSRVIGLIVVGVVFAALLTPLTGASLSLWRCVPAFVRDTTGNWVMNRLYSIFAATVLFAGAGTLMIRSRGMGQRARTWLTGALIGLCGWSGLEGMKFSVSSKEHRRPPESAEQMLRPENVMITRFAYLVFPKLPDYFTNGVVDPALELRFFSNEGKMLWSNNQAILEAWKSGDPRARTVQENGFEAEDATGSIWNATDDFTLKSGEHYLVMFNFTEQLPPPGLIQFSWNGQVREYLLPEYGGTKAFGNGPESAHYVPLWNTAAHDAVVHTRYISSSPTTALALSSLKVTFIHYDPALLPAQVTSWMPLKVSFKQSQEGWLETPRSYHVDYLRGSPVGRIKKSAQDLVMVKIVSNERNVTISSEPPLSQKLLFWLSFLSVFMAFGYCGVSELNRKDLTSRSASVL